MPPNSPVFGFSSVFAPNRPGFGFSSGFFSVFSSVDLPKLKPVDFSSFFGSAAAGGLKLKVPFVSVWAWPNSPPSLAKFGFDSVLAGSLGANRLGLGGAASLGAKRLGLAGSFGAKRPPFWGSLFPPNRFGFGFSSGSFCGAPNPVNGFGFSLIL